jgi:hypothetical protein
MFVGRYPGSVGFIEPRVAADLGVGRTRVVARSCDGDSGGVDCHMKDAFPYLDRFDSVGLDCSSCRHFRAPASWPDLGRETSCALHQVSLEVELGSNGYKLGEWFCSAVASAGRVNQAALAHLESIRSTLDPTILYGFCGSDGNLKEQAFKVLRGRPTNG